MNDQNRQPNLVKELRNALELDPRLNPNKGDGEYQYLNDLGVILRCLLADNTDEQIMESLDRHSYKSSAYGSALNFIRKVAKETAR